MIRRLIERYRTWRAYRHERRRAAERALQQARICAAAGMLTSFRK